MTDRPILFSGPMVRAILDGRKTQTRRVLKPQPPSGAPLVGIYAPGLSAVWQMEEGDFKVRLQVKPKDRLWVRETFLGARGYDNDPPSKFGNKPLWYVADGEPDREHWWHLSDRKRPSIHMPRWASRITLIVEDVRVQRLQEISDKDAEAEGVTPQKGGRYHCGYDEEGEITCRHPVTAFAWLWDSLNAGRVGCSWSDNPWICAVSFHVHMENIDAI